MNKKTKKRTNGFFYSTKHSNPCPIFFVHHLFICSSCTREIHYRHLRKLDLECDLNGLQYVPITLTQGTSETFTVDVDLPRPGGNYVLSCFTDYGAGKYYGDSWVLFDFQRDKSRCVNKRCTWQINENGAFLLLRFYEWKEEGI